MVVVSQIKMHALCYWVACMRLCKRTVLRGAFVEGTSFACVFCWWDTVRFVDLASMNAGVTAYHGCLH